MTDSLSQDSLDGSCYLSDVSPRDRSWERHKHESLLIADQYLQIGQEKIAEKMKDCAMWLNFALEAKNENEQVFRLKNARFCRIRLCPVCQWRKQLMWFSRMLRAFPLIYADYPTHKYLFLTLTVKNCEIHELRDTIRWMNKSWQKLTQRKIFSAVGFVKTLEVTRSETGQAHPHFHCLLLVPSSYTSHGYIKQRQWCELWQSCLKVDYTPNVWIETVKARKDEKDPVEAWKRGVRETFKYSVKPNEIIKAPVDWLDEITKQLKGTKSVSLGGIFRQYLSEDEPENLIAENHDEDSESTCEVTFGWRESLRRYVA